MSEPGETDKAPCNTPTAWMARNHVAANLLMLLFLIGGFFTLQGVKQEVFPEIELNIVTVNVAYPGSGPAEIENGILKSVEAQIRDIEEIKKITSIAREGSGTVTAELYDFVDGNAVLQDIKNAVDAIRTFPEEAEDPLIRLENTVQSAIRLIVYGDQPAHALRAYAEKVKNDLMALDGITLAELSEPRPIEVSIEIPQSTLRSLNLTMPEIARSIRNYAQEIPAGGIKTQGGEILLRTDERREFASEFENTPILRDEDGGIVRLSDIATIRDTFEDTDQEAFYNGKPAVRVSVFSVGKESPVDVAHNAKAYLESLNLPNDYPLQIAISDDRAEIYEGRINLLIKNALMGLVMVLIVLGIFLDARLAFWVMLGLPVSILGSFIFFQFSGATLNMVSLFAFIITLGVVVDDAVIVGEAIYEKRRQGMNNLHASIYGAKEMTMPICFAILTNVIAFSPLLFVPGSSGDIFNQIPAVVISVLIVSLIESLFILPSHLSGKSSEAKIWRILNTPQRRFGRWFDHFAETHFKRFVMWGIHHRYVTLASCMAMLIVSFGLLAGGIIQFSFLPRIDRDNVNVQAELPFGVPIEESREVMGTLIDSARQTAIDVEGEHIIAGIYSSIGARGAGSHIVSIEVDLITDGTRETGGTNFASAWRETTPEIPGIESLTYSGRGGFGGQGAPIQVELNHPDTVLLERIARETADRLRDYAGTTDIDDGIELGKRQINFTVSDEGKALGLSTADISAQLRGYFYGSEAIRQQRGENEIKVMVRLPEAERQNFEDIERLTIRGPDGSYIPLGQVADLRMDRAFTEINRTQGQRILAVTSDVDEQNYNLNDILLDFRDRVMPEIAAKYPGLQYSFEGEEQERGETLSYLASAFVIALLCIYAALAIPFRSYIQPTAVLLSIPFGIIGAVIGHLLLGYEISIISLIGIIGLSGIVINDSLVLIVTLNRLRAENPDLSAFEAAIQASVRRLRPIMLTTLTTFFGLLPMLFETSVQARFLIPMAISISFGLVFATLIILLLVPSIYMMTEDIKASLHKLTSKIKT